MEEGGGGGRWRREAEEPHCRYQRPSTASLLLFLLNHPCTNTLFQGVKLLFFFTLLFFFSTVQEN